MLLNILIPLDSLSNFKIFHQKGFFYGIEKQTNFLSYSIKHKLKENKKVYGRQSKIKLGTEFHYLLIKQAS